MEPWREIKISGNSGLLLETGDPFFELWALEMAGLQHARTDAFFQQCHEDIQLLLAYTLVLKATVQNPFQLALSMPRHPRMNLI
jgi:hypothetical protein